MRFSGLDARGVGPDPYSVLANTFCVVGESQTMPKQGDEALKGRVLHLMQFMRELVNARSKPVRDNGQHLLVASLTDETLSLLLDTEAAAGEVALRSHRVTLDEPPAIPPSLANSVEGGIRDSASVLVCNSADPEIKREFDQWKKHWDGWARVDRERRPLWKLNEDLHRALQELQARPESVELVLASGLLQLPQSSAGTKVNVHLVTQPVSVERDERSGDLIVRLQDDSSVRLEDTQLFTDLPWFDNSGSRALEEELRERTVSPLSAAVPAILKEWAGRAATIRIDLLTDDDESRPPSLTPAPALILRKRTDFALLDYYERTIGSLEHPDAEVPLGLAQLVDAFEPGDRVAWLEQSGHNALALREPPLFPLPANQEQSEIIERLNGDSGVVVEGPPGTGKTHTIANLVSALLARGQRVLVTSEKSQALRVLRDKLPVEMQELCVAITDTARGGSAELNKSVGELATRKSSFSDRDAKIRIDDLTDRRSQKLSRRSHVSEQIRALREAETYQHSNVAAGYSGTAASIVRQVNERRRDLDWIPTPVRGEVPPLDSNELRQLTVLADGASPQRQIRASQNLAVLDDLLPPIGVLRDMCERANTRDQPDAAGDRDLLRALIGAEAVRLREIQEACDSLHVAIQPISNAPQDVRTAADGVLSGRLGHLWAKTHDMPAILDTAVKSDNAVGRAEVVVPAVGRHVTPVYRSLADSLVKGNEWRSRFRKSEQQKAVEQLGVIATVDGIPATDVAAVEVVVNHLQALECASDVAHILGDLGIDFRPTGSRPGQVNALNNVIAQVSAIDNLQEAARRFTATLRSSWPSAPDVASLDHAWRLASSASTIANAGESSQAREALNGLSLAVADRFGRNISVEGIRLVDALAGGDFDTVVENLDALAAARIEADAELRFQAMRTRLDTAAPNLSAAIVSTPTDEVWVGRFDAIEEAWAWAHAQNWVIEQLAVGRDKELENELDNLDAEIGSLTARLAAARAWRGCLKRMTASEVQALQAYREHVTNIGKGTGKHAERYRAAARGAMQEAQRAVPAWVMPLQQVLASIPPEPNSFDVVIVDEASQADITSIFLLWLAPRVIVVGDDRQCAPSEVTGGALDPIFDRLDNYLPDVPMHLRRSFTPRSNMFSLLRSRFGQVVRLREHFRCMPEIINWSSNQFYRDAPLIPVRQYGADRLPPLRTTFVDGGFVEGKNAALRNPPEATAIIDQLQACMADPQYDGKTFGIVVLQGASQVDIINNELLQRLSAEQWDERRLRVGTPPDFQGDERHVIFLSMVVGPEQRFAAQTRTEVQRRFNVAASRAQDQLWLFHSVTADALRATDLRHSLLTYMQSTSPAPADLMPDGVTSDRPHTDFDSLFEQRVFLDIVARGYHVNPQVEVNNRRIDLVVTGSAGRLAVECDGDAWHSTPDQQRADLERERELKRCGWKFWRIRESTYYLDPIAAMEGLWIDLDGRGISPGGVDIASRDSTATTWTPSILRSDDDEVDEEFAPDSDDIDLTPRGTLRASPVELGPVSTDVGDPSSSTVAVQVSEAVADFQAAPGHQDDLSADRGPWSSPDENHYGAWEFVSPSVIPRRTTVQMQTPVAPVPSRTSLTARLPPASPHSSAEILLAAAWHKPLTVGRATKLTRLSGEEVQRIIENLETQSKLLRINTSDGVTWVRNSGE